MHTLEDSKLSRSTMLPPQFLLGHGFELHRMTSQLPHESRNDLLYRDMLAMPMTSRRELYYAMPVRSNLPAETIEMALLTSQVTFLGSLLKAVQQGPSSQQTARPVAPASSQPVASFLAADPQLWKSIPFASFLHRSVPLTALNSSAGQDT